MANSQYGEEADESYEYLMKLFRMEFEDDSFFVRTFSKLAKMQLQNKKDTNSYEALIALFEKCDRTHSYSALWTYYKTKNDLDSTNKEMRTVFAKQIKQIRDTFIRHFKNELGEI